MFRRSASQNSKILNEGDRESNLTDKPGKIHFVEQTLEEALVEAAAFDGKEKDVLKPKCSTCATNTQRDGRNEEEEKSGLAIVPSNSVSTLIRELPEQSPGWPLLLRAALSEQKPLEKSSAREISVVQWAMGLPSRRCILPNISLDNQKLINPKNGKEGSPSLDGERGALVLVGSDSAMTTCPQEYNLRSLPKVLEGLHEKYSSICRLFKYEELVAATSNFLAGMPYYLMVPSVICMHMCSLDY